MCPLSSDTNPVNSVPALMLWLSTQTEAFIASLVAHHEDQLLVPLLLKEHSKRKSLLKKAIDCHQEPQGTSQQRYYAASAQQP